MIFYQEMAKRKTDPDDEDDSMSNAGFKILEDDLSDEDVSVA